MQVILSLICARVVGFQATKPPTPGIDRTELLRLAKQCLETDYDKSTQAKQQMQRLISKLPPDQQLKMVRDSEQQIRIAAITVCAPYYRSHVNEWCRAVEESHTDWDRCTFLNTFEANRFNKGDLIAYLTTCNGFRYGPRKAENRSVRIAVIESMGRAIVSTKEDLDLVISVLGLYATDGGHKDDRTRAFLASHNLYAKNKF